MVHKKKYHGGLKVLLSLLFTILLGLCSTSYASNLTPINQLTPEILRLFIDEIHNNQAFLLKSSTVYNNYNSFYSSFTDQNLIDFCTTWNNTDFSNYADYLEQCLFLIAYDSTTPSLAVVFSNNNIGNKSLHTRYLLNSTTNVYVYSIDDNNNIIASLKYNINFNSAGTLTLTSSSYPTTGFNYKFIDITNTFYYLNDTAFETPMIYCYGRPHSIYINIPTKTDGYEWSLLSGNSVLVLSSPVVPDKPSGDTSTGTITNPSGDFTGQIDLSGIEQGIGDVNNNLNNIENKIPTSGDMQNVLSGEVGKITSTLTNQPNLNDTTINSGDIESSLGFDFMADPYANFWYELTNGLRGSLTGSVRQIPVDWLGYQGVFDLDKLGFNYPASVRLILTSASTVSMVWVLVKWWKIIVDKLTSGNMDEVLAMNEEERHC